MSRSRDAWRLQAQLGAETGAQVEVRWDRSARSKGWKWHLFWSDGPSAAAMRGHAERLCRDLRTLDADSLYYVRIVQPRSYALTMVRNVRLGQPARGDHGSVWLLGDELRYANYPEKGDADDVALADVLARLSSYLEAEMPEILDRYELAGLRAALDLPDNVVPLRGPRP